MKKIKFLISISLFASFYSCNGQINNTQNSRKMTKTSTNNNPLLCDPAEGMCGIPDHSAETNIPTQNIEKPIKVIYFTDPICSSCWGIEPQLRKLKLEYGNAIEIDYHMGGLLPDWSYNSGGISKPSDVAHHWDEASLYYDMPIDGDVWLEDPLDSSYPPSIAFKAAEIQNHEKAILFLRELREMVFLKKKNITKWENIVIAAEKSGLDVNQLKADFNGQAKTLFEQDLKLAKEFGVRGFPTLFFVNANGEKEVVYGSKPYPFYETSILKLHPKTLKTVYPKNWEQLFATYHSLSAKEFAELSGTERAESEKVLNELSNQGKLEKLNTKNGSLWILKK